MAASDEIGTHGVLALTKIAELNDSGQKAQITLPPSAGLRGLELLGLLTIKSLRSGPLGLRDGSALLEITEKGRNYLTATGERTKDADD